MRDFTKYTPETSIDGFYFPNEEVRLRITNAINREKLIKIEETPIIKDIYSIGISINTVYDFVNTTETYTEAIYTLHGHLDKPYTKPIIEGLMRALCVAEAKGIGVGKFADRYRQYVVENDYNLMDVSARAMAIIAVKGESDIIKPLLELRASNIPEGAAKAIYKTLNRAYRRAGG